MVAWWLCSRIRRRRVVGWSPGAIKDPPCRGSSGTLNLSSSKPSRWLELAIRPRVATDINITLPLYTSDSQSGPRRPTRIPHEPKNNLRYKWGSTTLIQLDQFEKKIESNGNQNLPV
ncbi:hypothetical protein TNCV_3769161 [Trichonephila clavipes]|nr:hypothetical protein TNCV_3769161 [Trichonephila clavipes]